jgi:hypothetical protein
MLKSELRSLGPAIVSGPDEISSARGSKGILRSECLESMWLWNAAPSKSEVLRINNLQKGLPHVFWNSRSPMGLDGHVRCGTKITSPAIQKVSPLAV